MTFKRKSKEPEFQEISFKDLTKMVIKDSSEEIKTEFRMNLDNNKLKFPSITHLYLEIAREANSLLVKHENCRSNLEKGYSNILKLISKTLNIETIQPTDENEKIDEIKRDRQLQSLWKNREQLYETMSHYVRQIQNLREKKHRRFTKYLSLAAFIISIILPFIVNYFLP